ncbi:PTS sugar transporter subunit IIB [Jeotgalibaca sp. MA1X17-3]|uniref:PTS sugar transporter subunit IIB n=1 Tax=Jeotgalibaca sp. MA1X17-3 TaxID=2908211 RepID=UPI001F2323FF|nr:PTS sugar transporter subunit IIB [Jeotgalibaca sp. MA1X17-3]UJF15972.1 PTS sugar transporter subunit IIB [Jeotgalibaca sp. MA1X17-3]
MAQLNIMLVCSAGMSTSMLVKVIKEEVQKQGLDANVFAKPSTEAIEYLEAEPVSVLLLGPQVGFMENNFKEVVGEKEIPIAVINPISYGTMNGKKVLEQALELINK